MTLLHYLAMFMLGASLARKREHGAAWVGRWPAPVRVLALGAALLLIPLQWYGWQSDFGSLRRTLNDVLTLLGSAALIALALGWAGWRAWLERPPLLWPGRGSYSLYLYHTLVVRLGAERPPLLWLLLSFALTFPVAHPAHRWVEVRAIAKARRARPIRPAVTVQAA